MTEFHRHRQTLSRQERLAIRDQLATLEQELGFWRQQPASPFSRRRLRELEGRRHALRHRLSDTLDAA